MKDLSAISKQEQEDFLKSFDHVLCDVDGVLWLEKVLIPGAIEAVNSLKKQGKIVNFVSNNNTKTHDVYYEQLKSAGVDLSPDDLIQPIFAIISYLKKVNFSKKIYLVGMTPMRQELEKAGFKIAKYAPDTIEESVGTYIKLSVETEPDVGAVIADIDLNTTSLKLQKAVTYLRDPEVIFITGGADNRLLGGGTTIIGPGCFHKIIEDMVGRKPVCLAKPSPNFNDYIKDKLKIKDPSRVLFIGDSVPEDMGFATSCGYKKLLVFSGLTKKDALKSWEFPEELKPDYYADSLKIVQDLLSTET